MHFTNISGYAFKPLTDLEELKNKLKVVCSELSLKGSILISEEGINVFLAGSEDKLDTFEKQLPSLGLPEIEFKKSPSESIPFKKLLIKIKPEIITVGRPDISPTKTPAPYIEPEVLKTWLDEGREVVLLDTRNDYEIYLGKFKGAIDCDIKNFHEFPDAIQKLDPALKEKTIVTYCTGGIRCEKAAPILMEAGFTKVHQLEGGILQYFEDCQDAHYEGECFVFDKRIAVNSALQETDTVQCFACRMPVTSEAQQSPHYVVGESCPFCFDKPEEKLSSA
ncbi:MAG: rhodanese-like domain-containing protein [Gammaproteobacteria bacterium]